ncbi:MAG: hypothetical protein N4A48_06400 [Tepidibacter sp.]|jgi:hypothetical protein|uniref:hypothetical protein n=1 Tax=Tepidibacter sp. TaxID=2529387 RepID=UPI0025DCC3FE|nr:hypothetical protein [Tepidibacter sp.]MCT4508381.1 hypothetical protein [Tepidibacter sp.]
MGFVNYSETLIRNADGDILNFYVKNKKLFLRKFKSESGWDTSNEIIDNVIYDKLSIEIDKEDKIYGVAITESGNVLYIHTDKDNNIKLSELFDYDYQKYLLIYPYINKSGSNLHIIYYLQDIRNNKTWAIYSHYFDGKEWIQNNVDFVLSYPMLNTFEVVSNENDLNIFYINTINGVEQIFLSEFNNVNKSWDKPIQITNTNNKKLYLNVLNEKNDYHITWSEFVNNNLLIKYTKGYFDEDIFSISNIINISELSNCSFPTFIKTGDVLWNVWTQMNNIYSSYSFDNGKTWSDPRMDSESIKNKFIIYKFRTNNIEDLNQFKLNTTFGTNKMSFIGFKNIKKMG